MSAFQKGSDMKIKKILDQHRRDFRADYECEHCGHIEHNKPGYDDAYFHNTVIPDMVCPECGKKAPADYRPLAPKHAEDFVI